MIINFFIGTKAQYIKTAPLIRLFNHHNVPYRLIDSGQHGELSISLRKELEIRQPDVQIGQNQDLDSLGKVFLWTLRIFFQAIFHRRQLGKILFSNKKGCCILHGDTPTTLISFLLCKLYGNPVIHIEAGLRSFNIFHPFPEELIRIIVMKGADLMFSPSQEHSLLARKLNKKAKIYNVRMNSAYDELKWALRQIPETKIPEKPCGVITIHRFETIFSKKKMTFIVELIQKISQHRRLVFVLHPPTILRLRKYGLYSQIDHRENIQVTPLLAHTDFIHLLKTAEFLITDGGSIQEEAYYLNIPTLIMRKKTERSEGLGKNAILCGFNSKIVEEFFDDLSRYRHSDFVEDYSPSQKMLKLILDFAEDLHLKNIS